MKDIPYELAIPGDPERFKNACDLARNSAHSDEQSSEIGTLSERRLHSVLKFYYESDQNLHEIKVGRFFADILTGKQIIEIQTGDLGRLGKKLDVFLKEHNVTVVHPMAKNCVITPHTAWAAYETRVRLLNIVCENIRCWLNDKPQNKVN